MSDGTIDRQEGEEYKRKEGQTMIELGETGWEE